jgi:hypothetical protein
VKRIQQKNWAEAGFTLIELLVSMVVFIIVMIIASEAFNRIVTKSSIYSKMEESNVEGVIGLEILRHDLGQAGFGLPWGWAKADTTFSPPRSLISESASINPATISYLESVGTPASTPTFNDSPSGIPRALVGSSVLGQFTSAYFGIKGSTLGRNKTSQRWTHIPYHNYSASPRESRPVVYSANSPQTGDDVIMITSHFNDSTLDHRLIVDPVTNTIFHQDFTASSMSNTFLPTDDLQTFMVYGIDTDPPRMPFNRSDYFIKIPSGVSATGDGNLPPFCGPRTGVLYKATVNHVGGGYNYIPLLDCVADMQVVLGWDTSTGGASGRIDTYSTLPNASGVVTVSPASSKDIVEGYMNSANTTDYSSAQKGQALREHLKVIKVYILAQDGKIDRDYARSNPVTSAKVGDLNVNGFTKTYFLTEAQKSYRWKLYRIVVRPKNLSSNQL